MSGRRPRLIAAASVCLLAGAAAGLTRLKVESDFTQNFRAESPVVRAYDLVEKRLGGAGVLDVLVAAPETLSWSYLQSIQQLEERLRQEVTVADATGRRAPGLTKVLSLSDAVMATSPTDLEAARIPLVQRALVATSLTAIRNRLPTFYAALHGADEDVPGRYYLRIMLRAHERRPAEQKQQVIRQIQQICQEEFPAAPERPRPAVTGFYVLLSRLIESILRDQWTTFGVALLAIGAMMALAFRNPLYALVALLPNIAPILLVLGAMGWLGLRMNMGAAMIAAVSLGLSVDSSIHYVTFFRRAQRAGKTPPCAVAEVQQSVGRAVVFSTLALVVGFSVLCSSSFVPTIYFGVLVSLSMLGGLLGNLVLLPLLLLRVAPSGQ